jgi:hypothetical protein
MGERTTMAQHEIRMGKKGPVIIFDDAHVPSRGASLNTRAEWAVAYLRRMRKGEKVSVKLVDQALKWLDELVMLR